jgi:hypothetical protein
MVMGDDPVKENRLLEIQRLLGWEARCFSECSSFGLENVINSQY